METLYEMYFDEKLDFHASGCTPAEPEKEEEEEDSSRQCCLLQDVLSRRQEFVEYTFGITTHVWFLLSNWIPDVLTHSKAQDVSQVRDHYDRSKFYESLQDKQTFHGGSSSYTPFASDEAEDDFFGMFLGDAMVYTSGISSCISSSCASAAAAAHGLDGSGEEGCCKSQQPYDTCSEGPYSVMGRESLEQIQLNKLDLICRKLRLKEGHTHLDIGCGWGTLVNHSASKHGTVATGVTLSRNQVAYACAKSKLLGIKDHRTTFWCRYAQQCVCVCVCVRAWWCACPPCHIKDGTLCF
jgi:hypothetical protein